MRDVAQRVVYLVDAGGTVRGSWSFQRVEPEDVDELLAVARSL